MAESVLFSDESKVDKIITRIEGRLRTVHPDNGYQLSIPTVERGKPSKAEFQIYPAVMVAPGNDMPEPGAHSVNRRQLVIALILWVANVPDPSIDLGRLLTNVRHVMMIDERWPDSSGLDRLADATIEGETQYIYDEEEDTLAGAMIEYTIHYRTSKEDPTK